jgi:hypothetical protein
MTAALIARSARDVGILLCDARSGGGNELQESESARAHRA